MTAQELIDFETEVANLFAAGKIHAPVHLSGGNEQQIIEIFQDVRPEDYVFSNWRSHYHALLHGVPPEFVMREILAGRSMNLHFPEHRFFSSAIMGGILPIAVGVAATGARVWCFVGDMCASTGAFKDALDYSGGPLPLPITFVVEDNGLSTNSPTAACWRRKGKILLFKGDQIRHYRYTRRWPHYQPLPNQSGF